MSTEKTLAQAEVFQSVQYAQCWEDPILHQKAFGEMSGKTILAVASGGDNILAHLLSDPLKVIAADFNPSQIALVRLKIAAIRTLDWKDCIAFLGERPSADRWSTYLMLRETLSESDRNFWDTQRKEIEAGVVHMGRFESYMHKFQRYVLPLVHSKKTCRAIFDERSLAEQQAFYDRVWNNWRLQALFRLFFSRFVMSRLGRSKEQFAFVDQAQIGKHFMQRAEWVFCKIPTYSNPFLQYIFLRRHPYLEHLPEYLKQAHFGTIKERLDRIELFTTGVGELAEQQDAGSVHAFNLSDIFEYLDLESFKGLARSLARVAAPAAVFSYWNLLVPRRLSEVMPQVFAQDVERSEAFFAQDRAFVYGRYILDVKK